MSERSLSVHSLKRGPKREPSGKAPRVDAELDVGRLEPGFGALAPSNYRLLLGCCCKELCKNHPKHGSMANTRVSL